MPWWIWIGGLVLLAVGAGGIWFAVQRPGFVAGLVKSFVTMAINAILPAILKRKTPEEEAKDREAYRRGETRPTKQRPHPGEK